MRAHDQHVTEPTIGAHPPSARRPGVIPSLTNRTILRWFQGNRLPLTLRDWTDLHGRRWSVRLVTGPPLVLAFHSGDEVITVTVHFTDGLADRSDAVLERLLQDGRADGSQDGDKLYLPERD